MKNRTAFTMIELIFVIVIMGILGKFGVEFLTESYKSFIFTKINNELQANSEAAVEFIATRLQYRIKDSVVARESKTDITFDGLSDVNVSKEYEVLEWVGYDSDGYRGYTYDSIESIYFPTWGGILDLDAGDADKLESPETNTSAIDNMIQALSDSKSSLDDAALYFIGAGSDIQTDYGWDKNITIINAQAGAMHPIKGNTNPTQFISSTGTNFAGRDIYEYYKLAWTAYAIVNENGTLKLYWNYQPWKGENFNDSGIDVQSAVIAESVDTFRFKSVGSIIKIQICVNTTLEENYSICKEKTIF